MSCSGLKEAENNKGTEKFWRDYSWKLPNMGKEISQSSSRGTESPIKYKCKEKHTETHINQTNRNWTQIKNIKNNKQNTRETL